MRATGVGGGTDAPKVAPKNCCLPADAREPPWARKVADGPAICSATRSNSTSANVDERPRTVVVVEAEQVRETRIFDPILDLTEIAQLVFVTRARSRLGDTGRVRHMVAVAAAPIDSPVRVSRCRGPARGFGTRCLCGRRRYRALRSTTCCGGDARRIANKPDIATSPVNRVDRWSVLCHRRTDAGGNHHAAIMELPRFFWTVHVHKERINSWVKGSSDTRRNFDCGEASKIDPIFEQTGVQS